VDAYPHVHVEARRFPDEPGKKSRVVGTRHHSSTDKPLIQSTFEPAPMNENMIVHYFCPMTARSPFACILHWYVSSGLMTKVTVHCVHATYLCISYESHNRHNNVFLLFLVGEDRMIKYCPNVTLRDSCMDW
jgi:hypothetical protein